MDNKYLVVPQYGCPVADLYHAERNHQGKGNVLLFPSGKIGQNKPRSPVRCRDRLGGLLRYYNYAA
jgi:hypothetical protein